MRKTNKGVTKLQVAIIAVVIVIVVIAGIAYYFYHLPATVTTPPPKDKVVFGVVCAQTGVYAGLTQMFTLPYYQWVVEEQNAKGGLYIPEYGKRLPIELKIYDDGSDVETNLRLTEKAIVEDKVDFLFAPSGAEICFAATSVYEKYRVPVVLMTIEVDDLGRAIRKGDIRYSFPVYCASEWYAPHLVNFLKSTGSKRVGIIYPQIRAGIDWAKDFYSEIKASGVAEIVVYEAYPYPTEDLSPLIRKMMEAKVDAAIACAEGPDSILFVRQSIELGFYPPVIMSGPGCEVPAIDLPIFGTEALKGFMNFNEYQGIGYSVFRQNPGLWKWCEEHKRRLGALPFTNALLPYLGYKALLQAIEEHGLNREKVRNALASETFKIDVYGFEVLFRFRPGEMGAEILNVKTGCFSQWQGAEMPEIVWPPEGASAPWIPWRPQKG
ncbi:MAG: ABC transporter substrate-binding protein [Candidatus Bathyarchaeia archaeon]